jgi:Fe-S oxidoreductase
MSMATEPLVLNDELWERVVELTNGAMNPCYQCGTCTATCPWGLVRQEPLSVRKLIRSAQLGLGGEYNDLWLCTTCKACEPRCPRDVEIVESIIGLRSVAFKERNLPVPFEDALWSILEEGNPWRGARSERGAWAKGLDLKDASDGVDVLLYAGCGVSYDPRLHKVARATVEILNAADVSFGVLGRKEQCCGDLPRNVGERPYLRRLIEGNIETFQGTGAETILTVSPHCLETIKNLYPAYGGDFHVLHVSEYLADLVDQGKLSFAGNGRVGITYHDPCYLGRYNDVYEAPRKVLESIPGVTLEEMKDTRANALCCGGGGGRMWLETEAGERMSDVRVKQAAETQMSTVATACPYCIQNFEDSAKGTGVGIEVRDIMEVAADALRRRS